MKLSIAAAVAAASIIVSGCSGASGIGGAQSAAPMARHRPPSAALSPPHSTTSPRPSIRPVST